MSFSDLFKSPTHLYPYTPLLLSPSQRESSGKIPPFKGFKRARPNLEGVRPDWGRKLKGEVRGQGSELGITDGMCGEVCRPTPDRAGGHGFERALESARRACV